MIRYVLSLMVNRAMWLYMWVVIGNSLTDPNNYSDMNLVLGFAAYMLASITLANIDDKLKAIDGLQK